MTQTTTDPGQRVMNALLEDPRTSAARIDAANDRGMITLTGTVDSEDPRRAAEEIALQQQAILFLFRILPRPHKRIQQPGKLHGENKLGRRAGSKILQRFEVLQRHGLGINRLRHLEDPRQGV